jgi:LysR family glycine cleavage system transcriptional activator
MGAVHHRNPQRMSHVNPATDEVQPVGPASQERRAARIARRNLPSLTGLRAFEAAARHGSISKAAQELGVTHAAISRHVTKLEATLGAKLFERHKQKILLTRRGAAYATQLQRIFDDLHNVTREQFAEAGATSLLRIGVQSTFAIRFLIPRLAKFKSEHPDLTVHVESSHKPVDPRSADVDVAIWTGYGNWPALAAVRLFDEEIVPVASPALLAQHPVRSVADLPRLLLLQNESRPDDWLDWLSALGAKDVDASSGLRLEYSALVYEGAINALGIAMAQPILVREDIVSKRLRPVIDTRVKTGRTYYAVFVEANPRADAIARFVAWLKHEVDLASMPHEPPRMSLVARRNPARKG